MLAIAIPTVVLAVLSGSLPAEQGAIELRYRGTFSKASRDAEPTGEPVKRFDLYCLSTPRNEGGRELAFVLDEQGGGGWPWPARFGTMALDSKLRPAKNRLHLLHEHSGTPYVLALPLPYFEFFDRLAADSRWEAPRPAELPNQNDPAARGSIGFLPERRSATATVGGSTSPIISARKNRCGSPSISPSWSKRSDAS